MLIYQPELSMKWDELVYFEAKDKPRVGKYNLHRINIFSWTQDGRNYLNFKSVGFLLTSSSDSVCMHLENPWLFQIISRPWKCLKLVFGPWKSLIFNWSTDKYKCSCKQHANVSICLWVCEHTFVFLPSPILLLSCACMLSHRCTTHVYALHVLSCNRFEKSLNF